VAPPAGAPAAAAASRTTPADREAVLARTPPERQKLFRLVRQVLDDLEEAAPWDDLYYPPDAPEALLGMLAGLLGVVDGIPTRLRELIAALSLLADDDETRQTLEEADFYYAGIHGMCTHGLERLRSLLEPYSDPAAPSPTAADRRFLCEVAADLKGKYASALMGATASIVCADRWSSVEVEPLLFPEKQDEPQRNAALAKQLERSLVAIGELPAQVPFGELLERWRAGARVDPYALADLSTFRGIVGQLLKRNVRRALYSGDYHQIQRREKALASRMAVLEAAHDTTWTDLPNSPAEVAALYERLSGLTLEIAAILDIDLLEKLVGGRAVKDLRMAVTSDRAVADDKSKSRRKPLSPELEALVPLLAEEDLKTFLELLLGSVLKRATFASARPAPASAQLLSDSDGDDTGELLPSLEDVSVTEPVAPRPAPAARKPVAPPAAPAAPVARRPEPPARQPEPAAAPAVSAERRREVLTSLNQILSTLQSPSNAHHSAFRMLQRLIARHAHLPPSMVQGAHPFFFGVLNELVPQLEAAAAIGAVPAEARAKLVECCLKLTDQNLSPERMAEQVPANLARLQRLLEALTTSAAAQLRAAGG
jgi:hypothetical protein